MSDEEYDLNDEQYETMPTSEEVYAKAAEKFRPDDDVYGPYIWKRRAEAQAQEQVRSDAKQLAEQGAGLRNAPPAPAADYDNMPHKRLRPMVTEGVNPGSVGEMEKTWTEIGNGMVEFNDEIADAINKSGGWEGKAGDAARSFSAEFGRWSGESGTNAQLAARNAAIQSEAASTAKNTMPELVPYDPQAVAELSATPPKDFTDQQETVIDQYQAHKEAQRQAAQVVRTYDKNLHQVAASSPRFPQPPQFGDQSGTSYSGGTVNDYSGGSGTGYSGGSGTGYSGGTGTGSGYTSGNNTGSGDAGETDSPAGTSSASYVPPASGYTTLPGGTGGYTGTGSPSGGFVGTTGPGGGTGPGRDSGTATGRGGTGTGRGGTNTGPGRSGTGTGRFGSGRTGALGPGSGLGRGAGDAATRLAPGGRTGSAAPETATSSRATSTTSARASTSGAYGAGAAPRGGGNGDGDDEEHERKFTIEEDPNDLFLGDMPRTAPPVIGE